MAGLFQERSKEAVSLRLVLILLIHQMDFGHQHVVRIKPQRNILGILEASNE
jgi:hypothetical protein